MKAGALFSGIGGFCLGFEPEGLPTEWAVEKDAYAHRTYRENVTGAKVLLADIRDVTVTKHKLAPVDVLHAGFPCQSFSQAGRRAGFEDERGRLFFEIMRLVKEFGAEKPKVLVFENSPYLRSGDGGAWFLTLQNAIRRAGYWFQDENAEELNAATLTALPQQRNRLFMVALSMDHFSSGRMTFPTPMASLSKDLSTFIDFENDVDDYYYLPKDNRYYDMIKQSEIGKRQIYQLRKYLVRAKDEGVCPTLTANMGQGGHNVPFVFAPSGLRKLTEYECLALQGFPKSFLFPDDVPKAKRYTQIGNAVAVPVANRVAKTVKMLLDKRQALNEQSRIHISN